MQPTVERNHECIKPLVVACKGPRPSTGGTQWGGQGNSMRYPILKRCAGLVRSVTSMGFSLSL